MKSQDFLNSLRKQGRYTFTTGQAQEALGLSKVATLNAIHRLRQKQLVVSPARGFYLIVPPEYQAFGCLPAEMFVPNLMKHFNLPYYVGFLSAAQYYGAAHQKPQRFQIVTTKNRPAIHCGRIYIEFIAKKNAAQVPTKNFNTVAGTISVSTPEALAIDLMSAPKHAVGINNVATILSELGESIDPDKLIALNKVFPELTTMQRLGYLFEFLGFKEIANKILELLVDLKLHWVKLAPSTSYQAIDRNQKWKIIVNVKVETDE